MPGINPTNSGVASTPQSIAGIISILQDSARRGNTFFVDGNLGSASNNGRSPSAPFLTMAAAFAIVRSGDTIRFRGNIREQLSTPVGVFDVTIIGDSPRPRHADAHTGNNGYSSATWKAPASPTATTPFLRILQQGWRVENVLFSGQSGYAAVDIVRNADSGDDERDGSHAAIVGCRFAGGVDGIRLGKAGAYTENVFDVLIEGNQFNDQSGTSIVGITGWRALIQNNHFMSNVNHLVAPLTQSIIRDNTFGKFTTKAIDLTGGANNSLYRNSLAGTYSNVGGYTGTSTDEWGGNYNVLSGGITAADPG